MKRNKRCIKIFSFSFASALLMSLAFIAAPVKAAGDVVAPKAKVKYNILEKCYDKDHIVYEIYTGQTSDGNATVYTGKSSDLFLDDTLPTTSYIVTEDGEDIPDDPEPEKCSTIIEKLYGPAPNMSNPGAYFESIGYSNHGSLSGDYGNMRCLRLYYGPSGNETENIAGDVCWQIRDPNNDYYDWYQVYPNNDVKSNPGMLTFDIATGIRNYGRDYDYQLKVSEQSSYCKEQRIEVYAGINVKYNSNQFQARLTPKQLEEAPVNKPEKCAGEDEVDNMYLMINHISPENTGAKSTSEIQFYNFGWDETRQDDGNSGNRVRAKAYNNMREKAGVSTTPLTIQNIYDIYIDYILNFYHSSISDDCVKNPPEDTVNNSRVYTTAGWCVVASGVSNSGKKVAVFDYEKDENNPGAFKKIDQFPTRTASFTELIKELANLVKATYVEQAGGYSISPQYKEPGVVITPNPDATIEEGVPDPCYNSAGQLGWALCPLIRNISNAMASLYGEVAEDFLTIESSLLQTGGNNGDSGSGTYQAWSQFVGFGNIILIVFLLVIIFSQVTGVGIDNYGIKKALPKIIIAAVLINASFIICQLLVDLSNIVGGSLEDLLTNMGDELAKKAALIPGGLTYSGGGVFRFILDATLVAAGAGAVLSIASAATSGGFLGLLIPVIVGLIIALIAILFFFTLLGIRKAAIVTLVAVSPIAFACYMLPNLKKQVFDRWFSIFKAMLLAYPLCGLVIGGSNLASGILMLNAPKYDSNGFLYYFIIMLLMVVPYFFLPSIIRKSMGALSNLTQMASGAMRGLARRGGDRASNWNKERPANRQRANYRNERRQQRWAERTSRRYQNGTGSGLGRIGAIKRRRDARVDAAIQALQKQADVDAMRQARVGDRAAFIEGSAARAGLEAEKARGTLDNYRSGTFVTGTRFQNKQQVQDALERGQRYADATAQNALINKLASARHKDEVDDALYSNQASLDAALQSNIDSATSTMAGFVSSALSNGQLKLEDAGGSFTVKPNDVSSLARGHRSALNSLRSAKTNAERVEAMARVQAIQSAMMKSDAGYEALRKSYSAAGITGDNDPVKMAASRLLDSDGGKIKNKDRSLHAMLSDVANGKDLSAADYRGNGIEKISPESLGNYTQEYIQEAVNRGVEIQNNIASGAKVSDDDYTYLRNLRALRDGYGADSNTHKQERITRVFDNANLGS